MEREEKDAGQLEHPCVRNSGASWRVRVSHPQNVAISSQETLNLFWTARSWAKELTMMKAKSEASGYCCRMTVPVLRMSFS
jgi:hypothetical protein